MQKHATNKLAMQDNHAQTKRGFEMRVSMLLTIETTAAAIA